MPTVTITASATMTTPRRVTQERQIGQFYKADPAYGEGVAKGLGVQVPKAA